MKYSAYICVTSVALSDADYPCVQCQVTSVAPGNGQFALPRPRHRVGSQSPRGVSCCGSIASQLLCCVLIQTFVADQSDSMPLEASQ